MVCVWTFTVVTRICGVCVRACRSTNVYCHSKSGLPFFQSTALLGGGSRDRSPLVSLGIFSIATDGTMCPGVDSASKNEY